MPKAPAKNTARQSTWMRIDIHSINLDEGSMWISQILERVSDEALKNLSREKIAKVFPKQFSNAKSHLVLKIPKTEGSLRK